MSTDKQIVFTEIENLLTLEQLDAAASKLASISPAIVDTFHSVRLKALLEEKRNNWTLALESWEKLWSRNPKGKFILLKKGNCLEKLSLYDKVLTHNNYALTIYPNNYNFVRGKVKALIELYRQAEAISYLKELIKLNKELSFVNKLLYDIYLSNKRFELVTPYAKAIYTENRDPYDLENYFHFLYKINAEALIERHLNAIKRRTDIPVTFYIKALLAAQKYKETLNYLATGDLAESEKKSFKFLSYFGIRDFEAAYPLIQKLNIEDKKKFAWQIRTTERMWDFFIKTKLKLEHKDFNYSIIKKIYHNRSKFLNEDVEWNNELVIMFLHSLEHGGEERQLINSIIALKKYASIYKVVVCINKCYNEEELDFFLPFLKQESIEVINLSLLRKERSSYFVHGWLEENYDESIQSRTFLTDLQLKLKIISDYRPKTIVVRTGDQQSVALAGILLGVPNTVVHFANMDLYGTRDIENLKRESTNRSFQLLSKSDNLKLSANSDIAIKFWSEQLNTNTDKWFFLPNGIDFKALQTHTTTEQHAIREKLGIKSTDYIIGGVFRLHPIKNLLFFIEVVAGVISKLPNCHVLIVGDGIMREGLENKVRQLGLEQKIHLVGSIQAGIGNYYSLMDVFLMTSFSESLPNVIIEAQSFGIPVVSSDVGGIREGILEKETGWLFEEFDSEQFINQIIELLKDVPLREEIRAKARKYTEDRFGLSNLAKKLVQLIN